MADNDADDHEMEDDSIGSIADKSVDSNSGNVWDELPLNVSSNSETGNFVWFDIIRILLYWYFMNCLIYMVIIFDRTENSVRSYKRTCGKMRRIANSWRSK